MYFKLYQAIYSNSLTSVNDKCTFEITSYTLDQTIYINSLTSVNDKCIFEITSYTLDQTNVTAQPLLSEKTADGSLPVVTVLCGQEGEG